MLYVSALQIAPNTIFCQQKRFRGKINIQKPRAPFYYRALVNKFMTPFYPSPIKGKPLAELCQKVTKTKKEREINPYQRIIAREVRNWYDNSKMIAICHQNSIPEEELFELKVPLKRANMYYKRYNKIIMRLALEDSPYAATLPLYSADFAVVFGSDTNVADFEKIVRKFPQVILIGK